MSNRKKPPNNIEAMVLGLSARRCPICFFYEGIRTEQKGQIAHLDQDPSNSALDNLCFLCLRHHSEYDSKTSQHKNYTQAEVKDLRKRLYEAVERDEHLGGDQLSSVPADRATFEDFKKVVPSNGTIRFMREYDFGGIIDWKALQDIDRFYYDRNGPDHTFLDERLESARLAFRECCKNFLSYASTNTSPLNTPGFVKVPDELEQKNPEKYWEIVKHLNSVADDLVESYDALVTAARTKLQI